MAYNNKCQFVGGYNCTRLNFWSNNGTNYFLQSIGVANKFASVKHSGDFGDITYEAKMRRYGCATCSSGLIVRGNSASFTPDGFKYWRPSYLFLYSNNGQFSVWEVTNAGGYVALKDWTANAAVSATWNRLKVIAVGSTLKFYINTVLVWSGMDATLAVDEVGIGMYKDGTAGNKL